MSEFIWYEPRDGFGLLAADLHQYRWFLVQQYEPEEASDFRLEFYYLKRDNRWIECKGVEDLVPNADGTGLVRTLVSYYREVDPETVAHEFLSRSYDGGRLFPELEDYRKYGDDATYGEWLEEQRKSEDEEGSPGRHTRPRWSHESRALYYGQSVCLKYSRPARNQFAILNAFESGNWPESVKSPFDHEDELSQTMRDIKRKLRKPSPIYFGYDRNRVIWGRSSR